MKKLLLSLMAASLMVSTALAQPIITGALNNGNFDDDTVGAVPSIWSLNGSGGSLLVSNAYALSGSNSLAIDSTGAGAWNSPNAFQTITAAPGEEFNMSGSMLMPSGDPITDASFGLFKIEFYGSSNARLDVAGLVSIGSAAGGPFFGAESTPFINNASPTDTWIFSETQVIAPTGTVAASFFLLNVNQGVNPGPIYFDNVSVAQIPEPAFFGLLGGFISLGLVIYRRRKLA